MLQHASKPSLQDHLNCVLLVSSLLASFSKPIGPSLLMGFEKEARREYAIETIPMSGMLVNQLY
jgi:hypothetical protein